MVFFYFKRPNLNKTRIFIGIDVGEKKYRIGHKIEYKNHKFIMNKHFYEINEVINIIDNPDKNLIHKKDLIILNILLKNKI